MAYTKFATSEPWDPASGERLNKLGDELQEQINVLNASPNFTGNPTIKGKEIALKSLNVGFKAYPNTTKLYEVVESGIYLTPSSGIEDLPNGWGQARYLLIVFAIDGNTVYSGQILMPYKPAASAKSMAFRTNLSAGSTWGDTVTTVQLQSALDALNA